MTDWHAEHDHELALRREWSARAQKAEAEIERLRHMRREKDQMLEKACECFGDSGLHATTFRDRQGRECCDLCGYPIAPESIAVLTAVNRENEPTIEQLRRALRLAVNMLALHEPPDSRAVSDEFVALAAMDCGSVTGSVMAVIDAALRETSG